ncbi:MAG TPA: ABC transporter substrate-binding protein [Anaerolineae bacterium]|jgi:branched-chain amino acid transport system substrate-binding protein|nr:ABC transporter substrate-binding protein [Anaerolineae bacterium]
MFSKLSRRSVVFLIVALVGVLALAACGGAEEEEAVKVGAIFDLTGPTSDVGTPYSEGLTDFVNWYNDAGGVDGRPLELLSADYAYAVDQAEQLYSQYVDEGAVVFMGWGTGDTEALRGRIADDEIPFMSASYSDVLGEAPYNFLIGTGYGAQAVAAVQWAIDNGATSVAMFHHDSPFGQSPVPMAQEYAEANGVEFNVFPMPGGATDFTAELTQAQDAGAEYIIIQNVSSPASTLVNNIRDFGLDATVVCLNWCSDELFISLAGDAADGVLGTSPFAFPGSGAEGLEEMDEYLSEQGDSLVEKGVRYVQGWLTMKVMAAAMEEVAAAGDEITGPNIRAALESMQNFDTGGITQALTFSSDDHAANKAVQFFEVQDGTWTAVSDYVPVP